MQITSKIKDVQQRLKQENIDGWLLYDFQGINPFAKDFLEFPENAHLSRRYFYFIPSDGNPLKIVHAIESHVLDHLPGDKLPYFTRQSLDEVLSKVLSHKKRIAMEYSPKNILPYVSKVDAGTVELIRTWVKEIVSSASFLQYYSCVLDDSQVKSHLEAAEFLDKTVQKAWNFVKEALTSRKLTEYDIQKWILEEFEKNGYVTDGDPICAVNENSADPHYTPTSTKHKEVKKGDFILIDISCKKKEPRSVYADITRVGVAASSPTSRQEEIFKIVKKARDDATSFVKERFQKKEPVRGFEVDQVCRKVISDAGYGQYFIHRTGHNIYTTVHGPGAHLDSLETLDERILIPGTCFTIEPGIYLPKEFGVRLEYDVLVSKEGEVKVTGGIQEKIEKVI